MHNTTQNLLGLLLIATLTACGGSGGSSSKTDNSIPDFPHTGGDESQPQQVDYEYFSSYIPQTKQLQIEQYNPDDGTFTTLGNPNANAYGFTLPLSENQHISLSDVGVMLNDDNLYFLNPISGQAELLGQISSSGQLCNYHAWMNNPGEQSPIIALDFSGPDEKCYTPADNISLAVSVGESLLNSVTIDRNLVLTGQELIDSQFNKLGYIGLNNGNIVYWDTTYKQQHVLASSPLAEVITMTMPGSNGYVFFSDYTNIYWGLPSQIANGSDMLTPVDSGTFYHKQQADSVYFFANDNTIKVGNLLDGSITTLTTLIGYNFTGINDIEQTSNALVFVAFNTSYTSRHLISVSKSTGDVTLIKDIDTFNRFTYISGDQAIFINDDNSLTAYLADADGAITATFEHASWAHYLDANADYNTPLSPLLLSGVSSRDGLIENMSLTTYNVNSGASGIQLGTFDGFFSLSATGVAKQNELLISFSSENELADLYYLSLTTANSLERLTNTQAISEYPYLTH